MPEILEITFSQITNQVYRGEGGVRSQLGANANIDGK